MDPVGSKLKRDADSYTVRLYDYIPVNAALIDHVRKLDGFNVSARLIVISTIFECLQGCSASRTILMLIEQRERQKFFARAEVFCWISNCMSAVYS